MNLPVAHEGVAMKMLRVALLERARLVIPHLDPLIRIPGVDIVSLKDVDKGREPARQYDICYVMTELVNRFRMSTRTFFTRRRHCTPSRFDNDLHVGARSAEHSARQISYLCGVSLSSADKTTIPYDTPFPNQLGRR